MSDNQQLIFVNDALPVSSTTALVQGLQQSGWSVQFAHAGGALRALVDVRMPDAIVVRTSAEALYDRVTHVRACAPVSALVAMVTGAPADARIAAMDAGADACCHADTHYSELAAMLRAALRFRGFGGRRSLWRLMARDRVLAGPADQWVPLTLAESRLLKRLFDAPGWLLPRNDKAFGGGRALDVTVSRLRAKAQGLGVQLPLFTVRDWGYMFLADGDVGAWN
ncbi:response regulator transcription factor [Bordetella genomosp. 13]|uniref:response regulator transcription factor n=1 Tax=Bordetella genomosp. 13 TaxID=463040 RepID=UPI00119FBA22|nr:response regulator transcription factor [Bordetella genomosp. 13]